MSDCSTNSFKLPEAPLEFVDELQRENAKLRQLVRYMEPWIENAGARKTVYRMMAELGIEVES